MHQFSFDFGDPFFDLAGWQVGLQVITFENTYGLDPDCIRLRAEDDGFVVTADGLMGAGGNSKNHHEDARPHLPSRGKNATSLGAWYARRRWGR